MHPTHPMSLFPLHLLSCLLEALTSIRNAPTFRTLRAGVPASRAPRCNSKTRRGHNRGARRRKHPLSEDDRPPARKPIEAGRRRAQNRVPASVPEASSRQRGLQTATRGLTPLRNRIIIQTPGPRRRHRLRSQRLRQRCRVSRPSW